MKKTDNYDQPSKLYRHGNIVDLKTQTMIK